MMGQLQHKSQIAPKRVFLKTNRNLSPRHLGLCHMLASRPEGTQNATAVTSLSHHAMQG